MGSPKPRSRLWRLVVGDVALTGLWCCAFKIGKGWRSRYKCLLAFGMLCYGLCTAVGGTLHAFGKVETLSLDPD